MARQNHKLLIEDGRRQRATKSAWSICLFDFKSGVYTSLRARLTVFKSVWHTTCHSHTCTFPLHLVHPLENINCGKRLCLFVFFPPSAGNRLKAMGRGKGGIPNMPHSPEPHTVRQHPMATQKRVGGDLITLTSHIRAHQ